ncbi:MAG: hypothetical protein KAS82_00685 [Bacteroidales bacterium]|nr:hypothetical protein [Bacteroidales bacterium]
MKSSFIIVALAVLLNQAGSMQAQEPALSYRLQPGETYYLETDLQQNTHSESIDSEEISFYNLTRLEFSVDSIDSANQIHMSVRYRELLISMLAPRMDIDISSASGKNLMLTEMVDMLEQSVFHLVMTPRGELVSLEGLDDIFALLASAPVADTTKQQVILKTLEEAYGPDAFKSLYNLFVWIYPVIHPMTNWTNDITYYFNTKAVKMVNRYYLTKSTDDIIVIQGLGMLNAMKEFYETTGMGEVKSTVSGSQTYDFQMDLETGWLKRCISRQRVMIETTILKSNYLPSGLKIPSYTETVFEVSGGRVEKPIDIEKR